MFLDVVAAYTSLNMFVIRTVHFRFTLESVGMILFCRVIMICRAISMMIMVMIIIMMMVFSHIFVMAVPY